MTSPAPPAIAHARVRTCDDPPPGPAPGRPHAAPACGSRTPARHIGPGSPTGGSSRPPAPPGPAASPASARNARRHEASWDQGMHSRHPRKSPGKQSRGRLKAPSPRLPDVLELSLPPGEVLSGPLQLLLGLNQPEAQLGCLAPGCLQAGGQLTNLLPERGEREGLVSKAQGIQRPLLPDRCLLACVPWPHRQPPAPASAPLPPRWPCRAPARRPGPPPAAPAPCLAARTAGGPAAGRGRGGDTRRGAGRANARGRNQCAGHKGQQTEGRPAGTDAGKSRLRWPTGDNSSPQPVPRAPAPVAATAPPWLPAGTAARPRETRARQSETGRCPRCSGVTNGMGGG